MHVVAVLASSCAAMAGQRHDSCCTTNNLCVHCTLCVSLLSLHLRACALFLVAEQVRACEMMCWTANVSLFVCLCACLCVCMCMCMCMCVFVFSV